MSEPVPSRGPSTEQQERFYKPIAEELLTLTPQAWKSVRLTLTLSAGEDGPDAFGMTHEIASPDGHRDIVMPSDTLFDLTFKLFSLFRDAGTPWKQMTLDLRELLNGDWNFNCRFAY